MKRTLMKRTLIKSSKCGCKEFRVERNAKYGKICEEETKMCKKHFEIYMKGIDDENEYLKTLFEHKNAVSMDRIIRENKPKPTPRPDPGINTSGPCGGD